MLGQSVTQIEGILRLPVGQTLEEGGSLRVGLGAVDRLEEEDRLEDGQPRSRKTHVAHAARATTGTTSRRHGSNNF